MHCSSSSTSRQQTLQELNTHTQQEALVFFDGTYAAHEANDHDKRPRDDQEVGSWQWRERRGEGGKVPLGNSQPDAYTKDSTASQLGKQRETKKLSYCIQTAQIWIHINMVVEQTSSHT